MIPAGYPPGITVEKNNASTSKSETPTKASISISKMLGRSDARLWHIRLTPFTLLQSAKGFYITK
jgi:hypothetical protein